MIDLRHYLKTYDDALKAFEVDPKHVQGFQLHVFTKDSKGQDLIPRRFVVNMLLLSGAIPIECKDEETAWALIKKIKGV